MDISADLFFEDSANSVIVGRLRRSLRDSSNPFELPDTEFVSHFRLNKDALHYIMQETEGQFKIAKRTSAIPPLIKVCATLRFLATGSYQKSSGNDFNACLAQCTVSIVLDEVLRIFANKLCKTWITFAMTDEEINESKEAVYSASGFPGVVGYVDGTYVRIFSPPKELQHLYLNRKGYYNLNVMIYSDFKHNIRFVDARYPGANHDSLIWNLSKLKQFLSSRLSRNTWILGDKGYPLEKYIMTPYRNTVDGSPQAKYNTVHASARNSVERTIGILKSRFRCLLSARALHYAPEKATRIVNVCCALQNICNYFKVQYDSNEEENAAEENDEDDMTEDEDDRRAAESIRNNIMRSLQ